MVRTIDCGRETQAGRGRYAGEGFTSVVICMLPRVVFRRAISMYSAGLGSCGGGGGGRRGGPWGNEQECIGDLTHHGLFFRVY